MRVKASGKKENIPTNSPNKAAENQRGTEISPLIVDTEGHRDTPAESAEKTREKEEKHGVDTWTLRWAGITAGTTIILMLAGIGGVYAALRTLRAIEKQAGLMETQIADAKKSSEDSARDVQASIAEAVRSATAMEGVARSMAINAESVKTSVAISREIADTQKMATELQSRAYLSTGFNTATFQDANHVFDAEVVLQNRGNTPAYDVGFRAAAQIVPVPIPENFAFPLPDDTAGLSVSLMAPGTTKTIRRWVSGRVPENEVEGIKLGTGQRGLAMWGIINYRDAFQKSRHIKFAFTVVWIPWLAGMDRDANGRPLAPKIMSFDTAHHNQAD